MLPPAVSIAASEFDSVIPQLPNSDAVFVVWAGEQSAYLAKTSMLQRRLQRILQPAGAARRSLNLRGVATRADYWLTGSRLESALVHYALAKQHYPGSYLKLIKLRMPYYVRLSLAERFPRTQITARLSRRESLHYGPFRTRADAEQFEAAVLDLFQLRRCQEELEPNPGHPGCAYGEMNLCMRPCQQAVSAEEYRSEANRVASFLNENGKSLARNLGAARDRLSEEMNFEEAARQHKRLEQVNQALALRGELACDVASLRGVAVSASTVPGVAKLWWVYGGCWQPPQAFELMPGVPFDQRLRELASGQPAAVCSIQEKQEHLALLARWFYSSWRDGEWIRIETPDRLPYRKLARAINQAAGALTRGAVTHGRPPGRIAG